MSESINRTAYVSGVGSNPAAVLVLIALFIILVAIRWVAAKLMEGTTMKHKQNLETCAQDHTAKPWYVTLGKPLSFAAETTWGIGMSLVAGLVPPFNI